MRHMKSKNISMRIPNLQKTSSYFAMCQMRADVISLAHSNCHVLASTHIHSVTEGQTEIIIQIPEIWSNCPDPKETEHHTSKGCNSMPGKTDLRPPN